MADSAIPGGMNLGVTGPVPQTNVHGPLEIITPGTEPGTTGGLTPREQAATPEDVPIGGRITAGTPVGGRVQAEIPVGGRTTAADDEQLRQVYEFARAYSDNPQEKVMQIANKLQLPPAAVESQLTAFRARVEASEWDLEKFKRETPALASAILDNPQMAPVLVNDTALARLERAYRSMPFGFPVPYASLPGAEGLYKNFGKALSGGIGSEFYSAQLQLEVEKIATKQFNNTATPEDLRRADLLEQEMARIHTDYGLIAGMLPMAAQQAPRYLRDAKKISQRAALGVAAGVAAGSLAGGIGAVPGGIGGGMLGLKLGVFETTAASEGVMFYRDAIQAGVDPKAARVGAMVVGALNGTLEVLPVDQVLRLVPGANALMGKPVNDLMRRLITKPTVEAAFLRAAGRMQEGQLMEGMTEALQEVTQVATMDVLQGGNAQSVLGQLYEQRRRILDAGIGGWQAAGGAHLASPGVWVEAGSEIRHAQQAQARQAFWTEVGQVASESKTFRELPTEAKALVQQFQARYGVADQVAVPAGKLTELVRKAGLSEEEITKTMPSVAQQLTEAASDPAKEITIKTADVATHLATLKGFETLAPDIRVGDNPTAREMPDIERLAADIAKTTQEQQAAIEGSPGRKVFEMVRRRLLALGQSPEVATQNAALWQAFSESRAQRKGTDAIKEFNGFNVSFSRGEFANLTQREQRNTLAQSVKSVIVEPQPAGWDPGFTLSAPGGVPIKFKIYEQGLAAVPEKVLHGGLLAAGIDENNPASVMAIGGRGWATAVYIRALQLAQERGVGFASDVFRSDATDRMYARLQELGVPFEKVAQGDLSHFYLSAEKLKTLDLGRVEREMEARAEIQKLRGEQPSVVQRYKKTRGEGGTGGVSFQQTGDAVRGFFQTDSARSFFKITLSGQANLSTFIHETGHAFLAILERDALGGHEQSVADLQAVRDWLGSKGNQRWTRAQLETFARGFETYLWEGKAPSAGLAPVFDTIKGWMRYIYSSLRSLNAPLTDEVRGVMDRLLATDIEIDNAKEALGLTPPASTAEMAGMTPEEYTAFKAKYEAAITEAKAVADQRSLREVKRTISEERAQIKSGAEKLADSDPAMVAKDVLLGRRQVEGLPVAMKLDRAWLADNADLAPSQLRKLRAFSEEGGIDPAVAAKLLGFDTAPALFDALLSTPTRQQWVNAETDRRMGEKYPGYTNSRTWATQNAVRALHEASTGNAIWASMQALTKRMGLATDQTVRYALRLAAQRRVGDMTVGELGALGIYQREEARAAAEAAKAWRDGDHQAAYDATRRQLLAHLTWHEADRANTVMEKGTDYLRGLNDSAKQQKLGLAGSSYQAAINHLLINLDLKKLTEGDLRPDGSLHSALEEIRANGGTVVTPDWLEYGTPGRSYDEMKVSEAQQVITSAQNIEHLAQTAGKLILAKKKIEFNGAVNDLTTSILVNRFDPATLSLGVESGGGKGSVGGALPPPGNPYGLAVVVRSLRQGDWHMKKIEFLVRMLDGNQPAGFAHKLIFQPFVDAEVRESEFFHRTMKELRSVYYTDLSLKERFAYDRMVPFLDKSYKLRDVLMIALNMRDPDASERLLSSQGWTREAVLQRLDKLLDDKGLGIVNRLGALTESLWPEVEAVYKRVTGVGPTKVVGADVTLPSGRVINGGYFPIIKDYDAIQAKSRMTAEGLWERDFMAPAVGHGFTEERGRNDGVPLKLSFDVLPHHLIRVIHYVTHYEAVRAVDRLTQDPRVKTAIATSLSPEAYQQIRPWLESIAQDSSSGSEPMGFMERMMRHTRIGASSVLLGLKVSTAVKQLLGLTATMRDLSIAPDGTTNPATGAKYMAYGIRAFLRDTQAWMTGGPNPFNAIIAQDASFILHRENYDRDLHQAYRRIASGLSEFGQVRHLITEFQMSLFNLFQGTVNAITWHGALQKAMDQEHPNPQEYASSVVRTSQAGGGIKDLAAIQRGPEWKKLFTVMFTWYSVLYNSLTEKLPPTTSLPKQIVTRASHFWWLATLPAILSLATSGKSSDDPEDYAKQVMLETALTTAHSVPLLSQATERLAGREPKQAPWIQTAFYSAPAILGKMAFSEQDLTSRDRAELVRAAGMWLQLPTSGVMNGTDWLTSYLNGDLEEPLMDLLVRTPHEAK